MDQQAPPEPVPVRYVDDAPTLKALSDPLRLAILNLLMDRTAGRPALTVREIADELDQPQTKLYRHVKVLQGAGLLQVADTRTVAGNVESTYRTGQLSLRIDEGFLTGGQLVDDTLAALDALWNRHHDDLFEALRADRVSTTRGQQDPAAIRPSFLPLNAAIPLDRAQDFAARLTALAQEFASVESDPHGVQLSLVIAYFAG